MLTDTRSVVDRFEKSGHGRTGDTSGSSSSHGKPSVQTSRRGKKHEGVLRRGKDSNIYTNDQAECITFL